MSPAIDSAITRVLSLDAATATIDSHGGSGFAATYKVISKASDASERLFFVKTGKGKESEVMFRGEHTSLNAIHAIVPSLCPKSYANERLSDGSGSFLATDFINLSPSSSSLLSNGSGLSLAEKLAKLHSMTAPVPEGFDRPQFGFPVVGLKFYAEKRLRGILRRIKRTREADDKLERLVGVTASQVVPRLLSNGHLRNPDGGNIVPVTVHGDLWSGNHGRGSIGTSGGVEELVFDPSSSYSHSEFEFGIMRMFGGFNSDFWGQYYQIKVKDEPAREWDDRVKLYELYHHLNHYAIFEATIGMAPLVS